MRGHVGEHARNNDRAPSTLLRFVALAFVASFQVVWLCRLHGKLVSKSRLFGSMACTPTLLITRSVIQRQEGQGVLVGRVSHNRTIMQVLVSRPGTSGGWQECVLDRFVDANPQYQLKFVQFTNLLKHSCIEV